MIINSIAVILASLADDSVPAMIGILVIGTLITAVICAMTPQQEWPHDILDRTDGHGWEDER